MTMCGVVSNRLFAPSPALEEVTQPEDDTLTVDQLVLPKSQAAPIGDGGSGGGETFSGGDSVGCMNFFGDLGAAVGQLAGERWGESEPASTFGQEVGSLVGSQLGGICDWTLPGTQDPGPDASVDPLPAAAPPPSSTDPCVTQEREAPGNARTGISREPAGASAPNSSNATTGDTSTAPTTGAQSSTSTSANGSGSPSASSSSSTANSSMTATRTPPVRPAYPRVPRTRRTKATVRAAAPRTARPRAVARALHGYRHRIDRQPNGRRVQRPQQQQRKLPRPRGRGGR